MLTRLRTLLAGRADALARWLDEPGPGWPLVCVVVILLGGGLYGTTLGLWRSPIQAVYTAIKFPLLVFLTCGANAILNGMLAQVLGLELSFRQTTQTILMSFALAAMILCAFSPVMLFLLWNTPPLEARNATGSHSIILLAHVVVIALAGVAGARRLFRLIVQTSGSAVLARRVLFGWLAGNLLLGAQLAWVLRPFIGSPQLPVQFLRADPLRGNCVEAGWRAFHPLI